MVYGGYAEEIVVPAASVMLLPPGVPMSTAASFLLAYGTSYHALNDRANLKTGESVLVLGASGGVGLSAIELAKVMGAKVILVNVVFVYECMHIDHYRGGLGRGETGRL
jgi:NADPH2:quinone reductase